MTIDQLIEAKQGNREFILEFSDYGDEPWTAAIGNRSEHVSLGEGICYGPGAAEFEAKGATATHAILNLAQMMGL